MTSFINPIKKCFTDENSRRRKLVPWLLLCLSLLGTLYAWRASSGYLQRVAGDRFVAHADEIIKQIENRLQTNRTILRGGAALFAVNGEVSREQWRTYVDTLCLQESHPGIQGFGFAKVIEPDELQRHIADIREEGFPEYTVRPPGERETYTAIIWLEPFDERNQRAFGYDMFSEPVRRAAMEAARDTAAVTVSGKVTLLQETEKDVQAGFLIYVPVYKNGMPAATVAQRRAALLGYVYSPLRMKDLMQKAVGDSLHGIDLKIFDGTEMSARSLMFDSDEACAEPSRNGKRLFNVTRVEEIYGRKWTLNFSSLPSFESVYERDLPQGILLFGTFISMLLFLYIRSLESTREKALVLAGKMTSALRKSEERYRSLVTATAQIVWTTDAQGEVDEDIPDWRAYTGQSLEEVKGWGWSNALHPEDYEQVSSTWRQALENRSLYETGYRIRRHDGEYRHFTVRGVPVLEGDGSIREWVGTCTDITGPKLAEDKVRSQARLLDLIFAHSLGCMALLDRDYNFIRVNGAYAKVCQRDMSEFPGHNHFEFYPSPLKDEFDDALTKKIIYSRSARPFIFPDHPEWGTTYWDMSLVPIFNAGGTVDLLLFTLDDVTERVRAEEELQLLNSRLEQLVKERTGELEQSNRELRLVNNELKLRRHEAEAARQGAEAARKQADAASRAKSEFLANMSHELRTPLNSVIGFSDLLQEQLFGPLNDKQEEYVNNILSSGKHLLSLINDILDLSKVESGMMALELSTFPLREILDASLMILREKALKHGVTLSLDIAPEADLVIEADQRKLKQIMFNLLSNAIKFTPSGGSVSVHARMINDAGVSYELPMPHGTNYIEIRIEDTGIGIREEDMPKLFREFSQIESGFTKIYEGTGLGLALSKRLVELQGGWIRAESEFGRGSRFSFGLPVTKISKG